MKKTFAVILLLFIGQLIHSQYIISLSNKSTLTINEEEDNSNKELVIKLKPSYPAKAMLTVKDLKERKGWLRTYNITDDSDNVLLTFDPGTKTNTKQVLIKTVIKKLSAGRKYFLYTWAKPSNPKMAAAVRIRRYLLCAVRVQ